MATRKSDETQGVKRVKRVSRAEFVGTLLQVAHRNRDVYRLLRAQGWESAIAVESECPN